MNHPILPTPTLAFTITGVIHHPDGSVDLTGPVERATGYSHDECVRLSPESVAHLRRSLGWRFEDGERVSPHTRTENGR